MRLVGKQLHCGRLCRLASYFICCRLSFKSSDELPWNFPSVLCHWRCTVYYYRCVIVTDTIPVCAHVSDTETERVRHVKSNFCLCFCFQWANKQPAMSHCMFSPAVWCWFMASTLRPQLQLSQHVDVTEPSVIVWRFMPLWVWRHLNPATFSCCCCFSCVFIKDLNMAASVSHTHTHTHTHTWWAECVSTSCSSSLCFLCKCRFVKPLNTDVDTTSAFIWEDVGWWSACEISPTGCKRLMSVKTTQNIFEKLWYERETPFHNKLNIWWTKMSDCVTGLVTTSVLLDAAHVWNMFDVFLCSGCVSQVELNGRPTGALLVEEPPESLFYKASYWMKCLKKRLVPVTFGKIKVLKIH